MEELKSTEASGELVVLQKVKVMEADQPHIISLCHDNPIAGHFRVHKIYQRIQEHYKWLNIKKDIEKFVQKLLCPLLGKHITCWTSDMESEFTL